MCLDLQLLFPFYCLRFKVVGFRVRNIFFVFRLAASFSISLPLVEGRRVSVFMDFFCFLNCSFFFHFIAFGLRLWGLGFEGFFFVFRLAASFSVLLPLL